MTDSEIEQWVLRELRFAGNIQSREVCVSAQRGIVTLGGTVPNRLTMVAAKRAALRARGVRGVVNNLRASSSRGALESRNVMAVAVGTTIQSSQRVLSKQTARIF